MMKVFEQVAYRGPTRADSELGEAENGSDLALQHLRLHFRDVHIGELVRGRIELGPCGGVLFAPFFPGHVIRVMKDV